MIEYFEYPKICPVCCCNTKVEGKFLICPNSSCKGAYLGNLEKWIKGLEIKDIGESTIEALYEAGKIQQPADFYKLKVSDIANLERLGEKSANKMLAHLKEKMELTLPEFIGNLNMENFSTSRVELLVEAGYDTLDKILNAQFDDLIKLKGIEAKTAKFIIDGLKAKRNVIENLLTVGITVKKIEKVQAKSNKLQGKSYCFTGSINHCTDSGERYTREMMENLVIENGGSIESVKKGLTALVQADPSSVSGKSQKAAKLGIEILSEADFFKMLQ